MVKKTSKKNFFYFTLISMLKDASGLLKIRQKLGISKQNLNYYLLSLEKKGYIQRVSHGVYEVKRDFEVKKSPQGTTSHLKGGGKENDIRGHAFMVTLRLPKIPNWCNREKYLEREGIEYKKLNNLGGGQKIVLGSSNFHIKNKSIILYENHSFFSEKAIKSKADFTEYYLKKIKRLERIFGVSFQRKGRYWFRFCREHYGLIKNAWAKQANQEKDKIAVYDEYGQWFSIDNSLNLHEAEVMSNKEHKAVEVAHGVQGWLNDHKKHKFAVTPSFILGSLNGLILSQKMYAENAEAHVEVIKKLGLAVDELRDEIRGRNW